MGSQTSVGATPAIGIEGDFASVNPQASFAAMGAQVIAGEDGLTVGRFAWVTDGVASNVGTSGVVPAGFASRQGNRSIITGWRDEATMLVPAGREITLHVWGDFFAKTSTDATAGQAVFASITDGTVCTDSSGTTVSGYVETPFVVARGASADELIIMSRTALATLATSTSTTAS